MVPLFLLLKHLGLVNTYGGVIVPAMASIFGIFLVRQYALSIPDELLEAARIDGASELRIFRLIVVPMLRPIIVTLAVFTLLGTWNDFMWPLIVLTDKDLYTLPVALASLVARACSGQRADDGRIGVDHASGACDVSDAPTLLHARTHGGKRQGMIDSTTIDSAAWRDTRPLRAGCARSRRARVGAVASGPDAGSCRRPACSTASIN